MTQTRFHDAAPGLLTHEAFSFIVDHLLKHALRTQEFLTLVVFVAERESQGAIVTADEWIVRGLARIIRVAVRETDLLGRTADGMLSLMLAGIDTERATKVIHRLNEQLKRYGAASATKWSIGLASCPTHAIRVDDLLRYAIAERKMEDQATAAPLQATAEPLQLERRTDGPNDSRQTDATVKSDEEGRG
jgi:GGDEF domain-containing protein